MRRVALLLAALFVVLALPIPASGAGVSFSAKLSADQEVPPTSSDSFGMAKFKLNTDGSVDFKLEGHKLSGPAVGAHIHAPAFPGTNAGIVATLCGGGPAPVPMPTCTTTAKGKLKVSGTIPAGSLTTVELAFVLGGEAYVNVHTSANPGGEMRGQIQS